MECCDGRGQRSIDDVAECGGPKEKLTMSFVICITIKILFVDPLNGVINLQYYIFSY